MKQINLISIVVSCSLLHVYAADARKPSASVSFHSQPSAEQSSRGIQSPVLGLIANEARSELRAMLGVPVASELGSPIELGDGIARVFPSPGQNWVLAEASDPTGLMAIPFEGSTAGIPVRILNAIAKIDEFAFSSKGRFAIVYSSAESRIQVIADSGDIQSEWSSLSMRPVALAIDDEGLTAAVALEDGSVFVLEPGRSSSPVLVHVAVSFAAFIFLPNSTTLVVADSDSGNLVVAEDLRRAPSVRRLSTSLPRGALMLTATVGGRFLFGIAPKSDQALRIDMADGNLEWIDLPCRGSRLVRLRNGDSFLIAANEGEPAWWMMADGASIQVLFSARPVAATTTGEGQTQQ